MFFLTQFTVNLKTKINHQYWIFWGKRSCIHRKAIKSDCTSIIHQVDRNNFASKWLGAVISVALHNSLPVSSPCRARGFLFIYLFIVVVCFCVVWGHTSTADMGLCNTLVTPVSSVLFISASYKAGRSVWHYSVSGEKRELVWKTLRDSQFAPTVYLMQKSDLVPPNKAQIFVVASCLFILKKKNKTTQQSSANENRFFLW